LRGGDAAEGRGRKIARGQTEVRVVEQICGGAFELEVQLLAHIELLLELGGEHARAGADQLAGAHQAKAADVALGRGERRLIEPVVDGALSGSNISVAAAR